MNDDSIAQRIRYVLADTAEIDSGAIGVTVVHGQATLYGRAKDSGECATAELTASLTPGVISVRNLLQVDPKGQTQDLERHRQLMKVLEDNEEIDASEVRVSVSGPQAVLWGTVKSEEQKQAVEHLAKVSHGAMHIWNNLDVQLAE
jgi:osmotically-inducible protein OsmY